MFKPDEGMRIFRSGANVSAAAVRSAALPCRKADLFLRMARCALAGDGDDEP